MKKQIVNISVTGLMVVWSADLLYLYFAKAWYDPNPIIEKLELVIISFCVLFGLFWFTHLINELARRGNINEVK